VKIVLDLTRGPGPEKREAYIQRRVRSHKSKTKREEKRRERWTNVCEKIKELDDR
jgi:hypothetical protein